MNKRRLIIDGQVFQTDARDRGMGRYSARLISAIIAQKKYAHIDILLTKNRHANPLTKQYAAEMFPGVSLVYLDLTDTSRTKIENAEAHNRQVINKYIADCQYKTSETDFLIPSPFQEPVASVYPDGVKKAVVFYDLIPYLYHFRYEAVMQFENYLKRFHLLFDADVVLAISRSVKDDLIVYLGIPKERIVTIDGAPIESHLEQKRPIGIEVPAHYVLMPTSDDPRKNNLRAVLGFEEFRSSQNIDYKLVITSKIHHTEQARLKIFSKNLIFTGNISEPELDWLYSECDAVLFVPESEGLGLPILEGVLANKRVICSTLNVFKEISIDGFYFCDHENQHSIALALTRALSASSSDVSKVVYANILEHYSWGATGLRAVNAIVNSRQRDTYEKPRLAVLTPTPSGLSAVGKVVAESHATLSELYDVDYYVEEGQHQHSTRPNFLQYIAKGYFPASIFGAERYSDYDAVVYHIGNSDYHVESIAASLYLPGYVILHDTNIGEAYRILQEQDRISTKRFELEKAIDAKISTTKSSFISSVCSRQLGVITHSNYAASAVEEAAGSSGEMDITVAQLPTNTPLLALARDYNNPVVGLAGIIADIKGIEVIESIAENPKFNNAAIKLFGYNFASDETIRRLRDYDNVTVSTNLTDFDFANSISKLDVFMNYRMKYQGETSLSTLEAMRQGVVVIVRDIGWYSELPDDAVVKVASPEEAIEKLAFLLDNPELMLKYSKHARKYTTTHHSPSSYAMSIKQSIANTVRQSAQAVLEQDLKAKRLTTKSSMLKRVKSGKTQ